jgi:sugar lactone lactonase YvrE
VRSRAWMLVVVSALLASCSGDGGSPSSSVPSSSPPSSTGASASPATASFDDPIDVAFDPSGTTWIGNYASSTLLGFTAMDLHGNLGQVQPTPSVTLTDLHGPNQLTFDSDGVLWVASWDDDSIRAYTPSALSESGAARASITITGPHIAEPTDLVFDATGALWVANQGTGDVVAYDPDQLEETGQPKPRVVLRPFPQEVEPPEAIAFDQGGRLWVSDYDLDVVLGFADPRRAGAGSMKPTVTLDLPQLSGPIGLTVDDGGRLWVAEATAAEIAVFSKDVRDGSAPSFTVTGKDIQMPHTVAFGPDGSVWIPCYDDTVLRYDLDDVGSDGGAKPTLVLR